jgi:hypothetical protein
MIENLRGISIVVFITLLAGAIAYAGDRVGHQIGRKRLTIYNIRPRYTSTIIAVGTGMLIALVVTLAAILGSSEVRTALFQLGSISQQIETLKAREQALTAKVNNAQIIVPIGGSLSPLDARFPQNSSAADRYKIAQAFSNDTVQYADRAFSPPLKRFVPPADLNDRLHDLAENAKIEEPNKVADIYLVAVADHNLFAGDRIEFQPKPFLDVRIVRANTELARGTIVSGPSVNLNLVLQQFEQRAFGQLIDLGLPRYFAGLPTPVEYFPSQREMQRMLSGNSGTTYTFSVFAKDDIYPHTLLQSPGIIPIVVVAQRVK